MSRNVGDGDIRHNLKILAGCGRKRSPWTSELYNDLRVEFEHLRSTGMKFHSSLLRSVALDIIYQAKEDSLFYRSMKIIENCLSEKITLGWVQYFIQRNNIVTRAQFG